MSIRQLFRVPCSATCRHRHKLINLRNVFYPYSIYLFLHQSSLHLCPIWCCCCCCCYCCCYCCCCCCSHVNSHNQVRGHRTSSSHSGAEEYPIGKQNKPKVVHVCIIAEASRTSTKKYKSEIGSMFLRQLSFFVVSFSIISSSLPAFSAFCC